ncbi:MAG: hypothetical protein UHD09_02960, partial [Bifidobacterium sp.]|nr:hypothetical protein [Bifidobacterium sp.]
LCTWLMPLPTVTLGVDWFGQELQLRMPGGAPWSATGLAMGVCMMAAWLAVAIGPRSDLPRLGAGVVVGLRQRVSGTANRRHYVWLAVLVVCAVAAAISMETTPEIGWWPLTVAWTMA